MAYGVNVTEYLTGKHNWYTPPEYIDAAREVMGGIDLDPASDANANIIVEAKEFYSLVDRGEDGIALPWHGRIFCNPPYGRRFGEKGPYNLPLWIGKALKEFRANRMDQGILLTNASPGASWFRPLWAWPICFVDHRIAFIDGDTGKAQKDPRHYNAFTYIGPRDRWTKYARIFGQFGPVVTRYEAPLRDRLTAGQRATLIIPAGTPPPGRRDR